MAMPIEAPNQLDAARIVIETITHMAREQRPPMLRVVPQEGARYWKHYPEKDARDARTRSRWYYHVHAPGSRDEDEHGHFHLFLHRSQMDDPNATIAQPPEGEKAKAHVTHIAGLSIDRVGVPRGWFVTNRFVTNEFLYPAEVMIAHLDRFNVDETQEDPLVNRFVTAMVALYRDEIAQLLRERDRRQAELIAQSGAQALEQGEEVLGYLAIDLDEKISSLDLD